MGRALVSGRARVKTQPARIAFVDRGLRLSRDCRSHPQKFNAFAKRTWSGLIRAKGHFWLARRPKWVGESSLAGAIARVTPLGCWRAAVPKQVLAERGIRDMTSGQTESCVLANRRASSQKWPSAKSDYT
ncbi:hypothetical protein CWB41_04800 [Methylovirgula ligni]|nr:hypothetical protein CWB41_04800 [Methylovirgula ligni]